MITPYNNFLQGSDMNKDKANNCFSRDLCRYIYNKRINDSIFDPTKLKKLKLSSKFFSWKLGMLECFVDDLLLNIDTPFARSYGTNGRSKYTPTSLAAKYFPCIPDFINVVNILSPRYEYSERVNVFIACCHSMGLLSGPLN